MGFMGSVCYITMYCTDMTNLVVISHHKICYWWYATFVIGCRKICHKITSRPSVIAKSAASCHGHGNFQDDFL